MADLRIKDLVVEYASGREVVRSAGSAWTSPKGSLAILLGNPKAAAGKTTLLSCLGGIYVPTKGRIGEFGDIDVAALDPNALSDYRRNTVGIVFQTAIWCKPHRHRRRDGSHAGGEDPQKKAHDRAEGTAGSGGAGRTDSHHRPGIDLSRRTTAAGGGRAFCRPRPAAALIADGGKPAHLSYIRSRVLRLIRELASEEQVVVVALLTYMLPRWPTVIELVPHVPPPTTNRGP